MKRYRCISKGKVQGVWYRRSVREMAEAAGFKGTVRNLPDGTVESVVDVSDEAALEAFKKILYKGSPMSMVLDVQCEEIPPGRPFESFEVVR
ncbi:acylphosphatase [Hydrogenimonas sp. SS33]|uniref:acylphosphatase n=1 Tax=Hydrogenimonas leucolamina TaxID=2954236 RepID=UPI00336BCB0E